MFRIHNMLFATVYLVTPSWVSAEGFGGFWKIDCRDAYGIQIKLVNSVSYSVTFCGPGGCVPPGEWMPITTIDRDISYGIVNERTLDVKKGDRFQRYTKCTSDTNPVLDYSTMSNDPKEELNRP